VGAFNKRNNIVKVRTVFTIDGWLTVFNDVFDVEQPTHADIEQAIKSIVGQDKRVRIVMISSIVGDYNEQA
jgi:hypothetical protein